MKRKIQDIKTPVRSEFKKDTPKKKNKRRWYRWLIELVVILAVVFAIQTWVQRNMISGVAPEIAQNSLDGNSISLSQYQGEPVALHFWSTWCPVCKLEQGAINSVAEDWQVLSVATFENHQNPEAIKTYQVEQLIAHWPTLFDSDSSIASQYGVTGIPATYIIDGNGVIRFKTSGYTTSWGLKLRLWITKTFFG